MPSLPRCSAVILGKGSTIHDSTLCSSLCRFAGKVRSPSTLGGCIATMARKRESGYKQLRGEEFNNAQVFDTLDDAVAWFRPGRLTDALREQLGLDEPERIE